MTPNKFITGLFFITLTTNLFCQEGKEFKTLLTLKKIGKTYKTSSSIDTTWLTYLGILQDGAKKDKYYVLKEFGKLRAGSTWHGHSRIYFYNLKQKRVATVYVTMPDNLPHRLDNNTFYFKYIDNGVTKNFKMKLQIPLPKVFCSRPDECDEFALD